MSKHVFCSVQYNCISAKSVLILHAIYKMNNNMSLNNAKCAILISDMISYMYVNQYT